MLQFSTKNNKETLGNKSPPSINCTTTSLLLLTILQHLKTLVVLIMLNLLGEVMNNVNIQFTMFFLSTVYIGYAPLISYRVEEE